ncbi:MAG: hypothetical protein ABI457_03300 [Hyphomicrobium sp.]
MPIQFKFSEEVAPQRREQIARALSKAGYDSRALFAGLKRPKLATIQTIPTGDEGDLEAVKQVLGEFGTAIEYVEAAPSRSLKSD